MIKATLLFLIIAFALSANAVQKRNRPQCGELECVDKGDECARQGYSAGSRSYAVQCNDQDTLSCQVGLDVNAVFGECKTRLAPSVNCTYDDDCTLGYSCEGTTLLKSCQPNLPVNRPGEFCQAGESCSFGSTTETVTVCATAGVCRFVQDGQACTGSNECNREEGSFCNINNVCQGPSASTAILGLGAVCDNGNFLAPINGTCANSRFVACIPDMANLTTSTCGYYYSQKEGAGCSTDAHCAEGHCDETNPTTRYGVCVAYKKTPTLNKECLGETYCSSGNGESCECKDAETSYCRISEVDEDFSKKAEKALSCFDTNFASCGSPNSDVRSDKCLLQACKSEYCDYHSEAKDVYNNPFVQLSRTCLVRQVCDASSLFASLSLSFIAVAFAVMIFQ